MKNFTFRAVRIIEDTLNAVQQAEEFDGLELEEYVRVMQHISEELQARASEAIDQLLIEV
jgi:peptidase E